MVILLPLRFPRLGFPQSRTTGWLFSPPTDLRRGAGSGEGAPAHRVPFVGQPPPPALAKPRDTLPLPQARCPNGSADLELSKPLRTRSTALNVPAPPFPGRSPFRQGDPHPHATPIIHFFPRPTSQQAFYWLIWVRTPRRGGDDRLGAGPGVYAECVEGDWSTPSSNQRRAVGFKPDSFGLRSVGLSRVVAFIWRGRVARLRPFFAPRRSGPLLPTALPKDGP